MALAYKWHRYGPSIIDEGEGKRIAWLGFGAKRGSSQKVTYEEQEKVLQLVVAAPELMQALARLAAVAYWRDRPSWTNSAQDRAEWDAAMQQAKDALAKVAA